MSHFEIPKKVQVLYRDIQPDQLRYHNQRVAVTKSFTFEAAHHLHCYEGKCKNLHGHTYRVAITVSGFVNSIGLVIDFQDIKRMFQETIEAKLDHRYLNEVLPHMNTSVENMVVWIWQEVEGYFTQRQERFLHLRLEEIVLYETPTSCATMKREWMINDE